MLQWQPYYRCHCCYSYCCYYPLLLSLLLLQLRALLHRSTALLCSATAARHYTHRMRYLSECLPECDAVDCTVAISLFSPVGAALLLRGLYACTSHEQFGRQE
jgi:hypothetical protein